MRHNVVLGACIGIALAGVAGVVACTGTDPNVLVIVGPDASNASDATTPPPTSGDHDATANDASDGGADADGGPIATVPFPPGAFVNGCGEWTALDGATLTSDTADGGKPGCRICVGSFPGAMSASASVTFEKDATYRPRVHVRILADTAAGAQVKIGFEPSKDGTSAGTLEVGPVALPAADGYLVFEGDTAALAAAADTVKMSFNLEPAFFSETCVIVDELGIDQIPSQN